MESLSPSHAKELNEKLNSIGISEEELRDLRKIFNLEDEGVVESVDMLLFLARGLRNRPARHGMLTQISPRAGALLAVIQECDEIRSKQC